MRRCLVAALVAALVALGVGTARACSCGSFVDVRTPQPGASEVPTNTSIWLGISEEFDFHVDALEQEFVLFSPEGESLELSSTRIMVDDGDVLVITSTAQLEANARYELWLCDGMRCRDEVTDFVTGDGPDFQPPELPTELDREHDGRGPGPCGRAKWVDFTVEHEGILLVDVAGAANIDAEARTGRATLATSSPHFTLGRGLCLGGWPGGRSADIRLAAFDLAGNFSGWSEPTSVSLSGCGCHTSGRDGSWLALVCVLALSRRRTTGAGRVRRQRLSRSTDRAEGAVVVGRAGRHSRAMRDTTVAAGRSDDLSSTA